jgi:hypothetical protein
MQFHIKKEAYDHLLSQPAMMVVSHGASQLNLPCEQHEIKTPQQYVNWKIPPLERITCCDTAMEYYFPIRCY